jgi:branched-chain amino acid aminotransferase
MTRTFELVGDELGEGVPSESLSAASARLPQGVYTTLRTYSGHRVLRLGRHVARLHESAELLDAAAADLPLSRVRRAIALALRTTSYRESRVRLTWAPPRLFASIEPFAEPPASLYEQGVWCVTADLRREQPHAKDTRFLAAAAAGYDRLPAGAHEALMVAGDGSLLEGLSSNFFAVLGGALRTEDERVLHGVTRDLVLEIAAALWPVTPRPVRLSELDGVSEAFITSVSRGIVPVVRIGGRTLGDGRPGPITRELRRLFEALALREAESVLE